MISFDELVEGHRQGIERPSRLLAFDPGFSTGWAFFQESKLVDSGTLLNCDNNTLKKVQALFTMFKPSFVVYEDYVIYSNKVKEHANTYLFVPRLIGRIEHECDMREIPYHPQLAAEGKGFMTDKKLASWGMRPSDIHASDAVRHGAHYLVFG